MSLCGVGVVIFLPTKWGLGRWRGGGEEEGFWHPHAGVRDAGGHSRSVRVWFLPAPGPGERGLWGNPHPLPLGSLVLRFSILQHFPEHLSGWTPPAPTWHVSSLIHSFLFLRLIRDDLSSHPKLFPPHPLKRQPLLLIAKSTAVPNYVPLTWSSCRLQLFCLSLLLMPSSAHTLMSHPSVGSPGRWSRASHLAPLEDKTSSPQLTWGWGRPGHSKSVMTPNQSDA